MSANIFSDFDLNNIINISDINKILNEWSTYGITYIKRMLKFYGYEIQTPFLWSSSTLSMSDTLIADDSTTSIQFVNQIAPVDVSFNGGWVSGSNMVLYKDTVIVPFLDNSGNEVDGEFLASVMILYTI
jgi:hypothetical protein